ncbi:MAG: cation transporter [Chitinophagaceae bacterium]|nr:cation transporter [Chitinophagaceae bacterium]
MVSAEHPHHHHHSHAHPQVVKGNTFIWAILLNSVFIVIEWIYGMVADSSALLADAGHNLSDVLSLAFAWGAILLANRRPRGKFTYGFRRTTILASLLNALIIFFTVIVIAYEAIEKLKHPVAVSGKIIIIVAAIGIVINGVTALLFREGKNKDLNVKGAYLHMMSDAAVSLGVVVSGFIIMYTNAIWLDSIVSFVIIVVIAIGTWNLFKESINLALDAVPAGIRLEEVRSYLLSMKEVEEVHDLHIWALSTTQNALTTHLVIPKGYDDSLLENIRQTLRDRFCIDHTTIQVEQSLDTASHHQGCTG